VIVRGERSIAYDLRHETASRAPKERPVGGRRAQLLVNKDSVARGPAASRRSRAASADTASPEPVVKAPAWCRSGNRSRSAAARVG